MSRGPKPCPVGDSPSQKRILDALSKVGSSGAGTPIAMRVPELSRAAKIKPTNLTRVIDPMIEAGMVVKCTVKQPRGRPFAEYRLAAGAGPVPAMKPLDTKRTPIARNDFRGAQPLPPTPRTQPSAPMSIDAIQRMDADQFASYIGHLARVWSWGKSQRIAA